MKFLTWQNPEQLFVAQELINKVKSKCCGIKVDETFFQRKQVILFDDIIASGGSIVRFAEKLEKSGAKVIAALALGKKIPDGYDNNE